MSFFKSYFSPKRANAGTGNPSISARTSGSHAMHPAGSSSLSWTPHGDNNSSTTDAFSSSTRPFYDLQNAPPEVMTDIKCELMVNFLHSKQEERIWTLGEPGEGVMLKKSKGRYACCPVELQSDNSNFYDMVAQMNVRAAMTVNTRVLKLILARTDLPYVELTADLRLQIIPDIASLPHCQKHQFAAFIATQQILVVWEDDPKRIIDRAAYIQDTLMTMIWRTGEAEKLDPFNNITATDEMDLEATADEEKPRRIVLLQPTITAGTLILVLAAIGGGWRNVAIEVYVDHNYIRAAFAACILPQLWLALFFFQALIANITQIIGPIGQMSENTKFYSGVAPRRIRRDNGFPHVTIQMPVYKEGLHSVIEPTIRSIKAAISTYELQGGTANIFVNDDGMQLLDEALQRQRQDFYDEHNIGWVARPGHNPKGLEGARTFNRRGKFKKASNMNYGLWISVQIEEKLAAIERHGDWSQKDEIAAYSRALREVIAERGGEAWADGNIRIGDYILLIDSDTRVPTDCFLDAVSEMERSPPVSIIQYSSGVMNVTDSFFEKGITFFTNLVYTQIRYAVANGDVAPFVGHNAILRWSALQEIAYNCPDDGWEKYWSESTVSEDFDMALRLQTNGYLVRLGAYKDDGFREGVSLTVYDELARWEKYAYGCNELIFHPVKYWVTRGPFTKLFRQFIFSNMPFPSKVTIMAYIGTYYALGSAWLLTLMNYFLTGWYNGWLDHYYIDSFKVYFAIVVVFTALGNIALAVLRYRIAEQELLPSLWENFKWIPLLVIFLGGISLHVSQALLSHMFGFDMSWGTTAKEVENISFFEEIPRVIKKFKFTFLFCILSTAMMIAFAIVVPPMWRITFFTPIWPLGSVILSHLLLPIVLNPNLMLFTW